MSDFDFNAVLGTLMVWALPVLLGITLHEAAHAYAAKYFGDETAFQLGRMSLNPIRHIDLFGTIIIPAALLLLKSPFIFGYAKPVPVHFGRLKNPRRDSAFVALAGPFSNLIMALGWLLLQVLCLRFGMSSPFVVETLLAMAKAGIIVNLVLFAFNLFPLPPLDGGRVMTSLLPPRAAMTFARIEPYGFFIVLGLVYFNLLSYWMRPLMQVSDMLIRILVYPFVYLITLF